MGAAIYFFLLLLTSQLGFWFTDVNPLANRYVEQEIDTIAVARWDNNDLIFFFDYVQDEWTELDHKWMSDGMVVNNYGDNKFSLFWFDSNDNCYRFIVSSNWLESWEKESPLLDNNKPWFARGGPPGLKMPR